MKVTPVLAILIGLLAVPALAAPPPYCGETPQPGQKPSPVCADAKLLALEGDLRKTYEAARARLAAKPEMAAALEQDEARFLVVRDAIVANLAKVDIYNRKEKAEFHNAAAIMRKRIDMLKLIDAGPRKGLVGSWGSLDGKLSISDRDNDYFVSLHAIRLQQNLDAVEDWQCWGMGETRGKKPPMSAPRLTATIVRGDGEGLPASTVAVRQVDGLVEVTVTPGKPKRKGEGGPVCTGGSKVPPVRMFPLMEARR